MKVMVKNFLKTLNGKINFFLKRQKIPDIYDHINIESTSVCNLKCKFCAYPKRDLEAVPHSTMSIDLFKETVNQAISIGYKKIGLTPSTGDIFMDKGIDQKFQYLDKLEKYEGFFFYTNFIPINTTQIEKIILNTKKLVSFGISIYGHDLETFKNFCSGTENAYLRLITNLKKLLDIHEKYPEKKFDILISQRSEIDFVLNKNDSELSNILKRLLKISGITYDQNFVYNNWGGIIKEEDVKDLNIKLQSENTEKIGSCSLIYSRLTIGSSGLVNACACRDANFSLRIGNVKEKKLKEIISLKNKRYKEIIENQEQNKFDPVCKSCDFYKSIYKENYPTWVIQKQKNKKYSLKSTLHILRSR